MANGNLDYWGLGLLGTWGLGDLGLLGYWELRDLGNLGFCLMF